MAQDKIIVESHGGGRELSLRLFHRPAAHKCAGVVGGGTYVKRGRAAQKWCYGFRLRPALGVKCLPTARSRLVVHRIEFVGGRAKGRNRTFLSLLGINTMQEFRQIHNATVPILARS